MSDAAMDVLSGMQAKGEYLSREQESGENVHGGT
ncbi:hypothetical protein X471_00770 [Bartonella bacilliformis str. Heidi Mejia]|nr:hypothetical protein X471_00770 [Bartonella bacilliformis str. Heidi Mejia]KEG17534.1 hypothetical protein H705_00186 [Bartonella bacilliformis Cond044]KEG19832.1 hypothetical protein H707_00185 [Bartonella bacilliformis Hosp800-02]KEG21504.1 hypothetical protein H704_00184 [Bartonella bacilliformis Peru38]KEG23602.1 hypothetical protein H703_00183 [Bartonella bacilliformis Ver075]KEG24953.1 hypothetical protein H706_00186 [Bartonella bacilliformis CAR600-02]